MFAAQWGRPDLRTATSFLTKRVHDNKTDKDNCKELTRMATYNHRTKFLRLAIKVAYLDQNHWFIDVAVAIHDDTRRHTGTYTTLGKKYD